MKDSLNNGICKCEYGKEKWQGVVSSINCPIHPSHPTEGIKVLENLHKGIPISPSPLTMEERIERFLLNCLIDKDARVAPLTDTPILIKNFIKSEISSAIHSAREEVIGEIKEKIEGMKKQYVVKDTKRKNSDGTQGYYFPGHGKITGYNQAIDEILVGLSIKGEE